MFHFQAKKLMTAYLDGELTTGQKQKLDRHIQSCTLCQKELDEYTKLNSVLETLPKEESRTEYYWQTQKNNILQKAREPVSSPEKQPHLAPFRKRVYRNLTVA